MTSNKGYFPGLVEAFRFAPNKSSIKIVLIGDGGTGKTSYFTRILSGDSDDYKFNKTYDATRGCNICQMDMTIGRYVVTLHIFDTAGQEKFGALRDSYLMGADGVILMYDLTAQDSIKNVLSKWLPEIKRIISKSQSGTIPVAVVGNKNDRIDVDAIRCNDPKGRDLNFVSDSQMLTNTIGIRTATLRGTYEANNYGPIEHFYISVKADENLINPINWLLTKILNYYIPVDAHKTDRKPVVDMRNK
jgi:small GTP-binding protein